MCPGSGWARGPNARPLNRQAHVAIAASRTLPILIAAIPACLSAAVGTACPRAFPAPSSSRRPFPVRPRPAGNKELGRGGRQPLTIAEALSDQRGKKNPLHPRLYPRREAGHFCFAKRLYALIAKFSALKNCALRGNFFKTIYI